MLRAGDSAYYAGDCHHQFVNPGRELCVYYLAMALTESSPHARRGRVPRPLSGDARDLDASSPDAPTRRPRTRRRPPRRHQP